MNPNHQSYEKLGRITKPHGLAGYFFFKVPDFLGSGDTLYLGPSEKKLTEVTIKHIKTQQKRTLLKLSIAHDRTSLEPYLGEFLWCKRSEEDYDEDGLEDNLSAYLEKPVIDHEGREFGICKSFYDAGAGPVISIENAKGLTLELPFNETYFEESDKLITKFSEDFFDELWQKL